MIMIQSGDNIFTMKKNWRMYNLRPIDNFPNKIHFINLKNLTSWKEDFLHFCGNRKRVNFEKKEKHVL